MMTFLQVLKLKLLKFGIVSATFKCALSLVTALTPATVSSMPLSKTPKVVSLPKYHELFHSIKNWIIYLFNKWAHTSSYTSLF